MGVLTVAAQLKEACASPVDTRVLENDVLKKWHVYAALLAVFLTASKLVFFAGGADAKLEEQVAEQKIRLEQDERDFARRDVIEQRIAMIEKSQERIEVQLQKQEDTLEEIRIAIRQRH